ncbi:MAG: hypothetical protein PHY40_04175, partial [Patescibacteria group bacterium]|nr:hypothetical protein [Patescibacteria group bacterium]
MKIKERDPRKSRVNIPFLRSGTAKVNTKKCLKKKTEFSFLKNNNYRVKFAALSVFVFGFLSFFALYPVFASPPDSPYAPGATLNPTCSPGDTNCSVASPIVSIFSATSTVTMNDYALAFHGSASNTLFIDALNSRIGIGTSGPSDALTVIGNGVFGDGATTSTLTKNSLTIAGSSSDVLGKLYIDSSGNISASGTLNSYGAATLRNGLTLSGAGLAMTGLDIGTASARAGTGYWTTVSSTNAHFSILNVSSTLYLPNNSILDAYLSSNVPLINANNTFTGNNTFSGSIVSPLSISDG